LLAAESYDEIYAFLKENRIGVVVVSSQNERMKSTLFYRYLVASDDVEMLEVSHEYYAGQPARQIEIFIIR